MSLIECYKSKKHECEDYIQYELSFCKTNQEIKIKLIDDYNEHHFVVIDSNDPYVINHLNNDISKLWNFIKQNHIDETIIFKLDVSGHYVMKMKKPVCLEYQLKTIEKDIYLFALPCLFYYLFLVILIIYIKSVKHYPVHHV